jgi:hypothetical protein
MLLRVLVLPLLVTLPVSGLAQTATTPSPSSEANSDTGLPPLDLEQAPSDSEAQHSALDQPIKKIAGSTGGCAILDKDFPGLRAHPMYQFFKSMTLNQIAAMSHGRITQEMLARAQTDFAALNVQASTTAAMPIATVVAAPAAPVAPPSETTALTPAAH